MKSFKKHIAEVAQPRSPEEKAFKDQHEYEVIPHPVAEPSQHSGAIGASDLPKVKASRKADVKDDEKAYDKATPKKKADGVKLESTEQDRARYDAADDKDKKKVTLPTAPWDKKKKEEELSAAQKKIDHNKNGKIDGQDLAMLRKKKQNEEVEQMEENRRPGYVAGDDEIGNKPKPTSIKSITTTKRNPFKGKLKPAANRRPGYVAGDDEIGESNNLVDEGLMDKIKSKAADVRRKTLGPNAAEKDAAQKAMMKRQHDSSMARIAKAVGTVAKKDKAAEVARLKQGLKNVQDKKNETTSSAIKKMVTQTGPDGKTRTVQKKVKADRTDDQGQDIIGEAVRFKKGPIRLKNGKQVMVSDEDAKLLTKMFKDLNPRNQKAMHKVMLIDPAGFEEIRGFAREAL